MIDRRTLSAAGALLLAATLSASAPVEAQSVDLKTVHPLACVARGPGTTISELSFGAAGVTNPGTTDETVLCPLPVDSEITWSSGDGGSQPVSVSFLTGAVPGRVTCTAFVTSVFGSVPPVFRSTTTTVASPVYPANTLNGVVIAAATPADSAGVPTMSVACVINPKVTLVRIILEEKGRQTFTN